MIYHLIYYLFTLFGLTRKNLSLFHHGSTIFPCGFHKTMPIAEVLPHEFRCSSFLSGRMSAHVDQTNIFLTDRLFSRSLLLL